MAAAAVALALIASQANAQMAPPQISPEDDVVIMRVNGEEVMKSQLDQIEQAMVYQALMSMQQQGGGMSGMPDIEKIRASIAEEARERVIGMALLDKAMAAASKDVSKEAIDARIKEIRAMLKSDGMTLEEMLTQNDLKESDIRDNVRDELGAVVLVEKSVGPITPTSEEIKDFFDENKEQMGSPALLRTSHILLGFETPQDPMATPDKAKKAELREKAELILAQLKDGEDFAKLAGEHSSCPSSQKGGDLGFYPRGRMVSEYDNVAWNLAIGEISDVVETPFGFHIIKATEKEDAVTADFDEMKTQIGEMLRENKLRESLPKIIDEMRKDAKVEEVAVNEPASKPASAPSASKPASKPAR